jgi:2-haloacid dehalogenase
MEKLQRMSVTRRDFVRLAAAGAVSGSVLPEVANAAARTGRIKAIAFDAFPIFDPSPVAALAQKLVPERGSEFMSEWRTRQFEYTWLRVAAKQYADFWQVTKDAMVYAAARVNVRLSAEQREQLMNTYLELKSWPDAVPALTQLKRSGYRLCFLSNLTTEMLQACIRSAGLDGMFDKVLSTDLAKTFKPDPRAYQLGPDALGLRRDEILFVPFTGWDAAGAKAFGFPTFWVNRLNAPPEQLGQTPDAVGPGLAELVAFLGLP